MKRWLALLLALVLTLTSVPLTPAHAHETEEAPVEAAAEETVTEETFPQETAPEETAPEETISEETAPGETASLEAPPQVIRVPISENTSFSNLGKNNNDALFATYVDSVFYPAEYQAMGTEAGDQLSGDLRRMYDGICWLFQKVASGERSDASISIGADGEYSAVFTGSPPSQQEMSVLLDAFLADLPYAQYWFDKTSGFSYSYDFTSDNDLLTIYFWFHVADNYQGEDDYHTDTAITGAATRAAANARQIVAEHAGKSNHQKLTAYSDVICDLVEYDFDAAEAGNFDECNDPWQMIYAFDGDPDTNIVCEGYSKAYKYLCDQSDFGSDSITCYTLTGVTGGPHMWNIVRINGKSYLTDVTNIDGGWDLLLAGGTGSIATSYNVGGLNYVYDQYMLDLWGSGTDSILALSSRDYVPECTNGHTPGPAATCAAPQICTVCNAELAPALAHTPGAAATCTEAQVCTVCGGELAAALGHSWTQEAVQDNATVYRCTRCGATKSEPIIPDDEEGWPFADWEWEVLMLVNKERHKEGLEPLTGFSLLQQVNDVRAEELTEYFSHTRPDGSSCFTALDQAGVPYSYAGENIAAGYSDLEAVMAGWMDSSGHRANILNVNFQHIGVGYHYNASSYYRRYWVQMFTNRSSERNTGFALVFPHGTQFKSGTSLEDMGIYAKVSNSVYGTCYLPVISEYCTGYDPNSTQTQAVTVSVLGFTESFQISRPAHTHTFGAWYEAQAPGCTEKGLQRRDCSSCDAYETREIDALGHAPGAAATCTKAQSCTRCGIELQPALGHIPGAEPACTTAQSCNRCGTELKPALGHVPVADPGTPPTCTEPGITDGSHCGRCGEILTPQKPMPATGHTPGPEPTADAPQVCTVCGAVLQEKLPHIADCTVCVAESVVYTGSPIVPAVTVTTANGTVLTENIHYALAFKNNTSIGKATVTITGMGIYGGKITETFTIVPAQVQNLRVSSFTGTSVKIAYDKVPAASTYRIYVDGKLKGSTSSTSYTVKRLKAGTEYQITVEAGKKVSKTTYYGALSEILTVKPTNSIAKYKASLSYTATTYDGTEKLPTPKLKNTSGKTLALDADYTVSYEANTEIGTAKVVFTGIGKYSGSITKTFTILPGKVTGVTWEAPDPTSLRISFDPVPGAIHYLVYVNGRMKASVTEPQCLLTGLKTGTTYKITVKAGHNAFLGASSASVSAKPTYDLTKCSAVLSYESTTYSGKSKSPSVTVLSETGSKLKKNTHYTVSYKSNKSIGLATVTVKGKGKYAGSITLNFTILPGKVSTPSFSSITGDSAVVKWKKVSGAGWYRIWLDGEPLDITTSTSYTLTGLEAGKTHLVEVQAGKTVNYEDYCGVLTAKELTPTWDLSKYTVTLEADKLSYTGGAVIPAVTVTDENGNELTPDRDFTVACKNNTKIGKATLTVKGIGRYRGSISKSFQIVPAQVQNVALVSITKTSVKISFDKVPSASTYRIYVNGKLKGTTSSGSYTIKSLKAGTDYEITVQAGKKVSRTTYYGAMSDPITATTKP